MRQKILFAFFFVFAFATAFVPASAFANVSLDIRYFDKTLYYVGGSSDKINTAPINVQITVINNGAEPYHFRLADDRAFSINVDARSLTNRALPISENLLRKKERVEKVFFRTVTLDAGESFSFVENIRNYIQLDSAGDYVLQIKLNDVGIGSELLTSNRLPLHVKRPATITEDGIPVALDEETGAILVRKHLPPDEVIAWTLNARQKSEWEKFFLYMNLEKIMMRDGASARRWQRESEEGRIKMLADFKHSLQNPKIDGDVSSIPMDYKIERTSYDGDAGTVVVEERFKTGSYIERKRFTYYLEKEDDYWEIIDYSVMNLGAL